MECVHCPPAPSRRGHPDGRQHPQAPTPAGTHRRGGGKGGGVILVVIKREVLSPVGAAAAAAAVGHTHHVLILLAPLIQTGYVQAYN